MAKTCVCTHCGKCSCVLGRGSRVTVRGSRLLFRLGAHAATRFAKWQVRAGIRTSPFAHCHFHPPRRITTTATYSQRVGTSSSCYYYVIRHSSCQVMNMNPADERSFLSSISELSCQVILLTFTHQDTILLKGRKAERPKGLMAILSI